MKKFPSDLGTSTYYYRAASGDDFCLRVLLENASDPDIATSQTRCASACGTNCNTALRYSGLRGLMPTDFGAEGFKKRETALP